MRESNLKYKGFRRQSSEFRVQGSGDNTLNPEPCTSFPLLYPRVTSRTIITQKPTTVPSVAKSVLPAR